MIPSDVAIPFIPRTLKKAPLLRKLIFFLFLVFLVFFPDIPGNLYSCLDSFVRDHQFRSRCKDNTRDGFLGNTLRYIPNKPMMF